MSKTGLCVIISFFMSISALHASDSDNEKRSLISRALHTQFPFGFINSKSMQQKKNRLVAQIYIDGALEDMHSAHPDPKKYRIKYMDALESINDEQLLLNDRANGLFYAGVGAWLTLFAKRAPIHSVRMLSVFSPFAPGLLVGGMALKLNAASRLPLINPDAVDKYVKEMAQEAALESLDLLTQELKKREPQKKFTAFKLQERSNQQPPDNI